MTRRVLASMFVAAVAFALLAHAQGPQTDPKAKPPRTEEEIDPRATLDDLAIKQERMQRAFNDFKAALLRLSQRMAVSPKPEDKEKARVLKIAVEKAHEEGIEQGFDKIVGILKDSRAVDTSKLDTALNENKELTNRIRAILALLLTDNRDEQLRRERELALRRLEELKRIIREQENARTRVELGRAGKEQLGKEQNKITGDTDALARGSAKSNQGGEAKGGKPGEGKGEGKGGDAKGEGKNDTKDPKGGDRSDKGGDAKSESKNAGKAGDPKAGQQGGGKGEGSKSGDPKDGQGGGKGEGSKPSDGSGGQGGSKSDGKAEKKGKEDGKGDAKGDSQKGSQPQQGGQQQGDSKGSPSGGQQAGGGKGGGQQGGQQGGGQSGGQQGGDQQQQQQDFPGKKQVQDAVQDQKRAEDDIRNGNNDAASNKQGDAVKKLKEAQKKLEDLLRQLREEEIERILAALQMRCERMLAMQIEVRDGTVSLDKVIKDRPEQKPDNADRQRGLELEDREQQIIKEANDARRLLEQEGSAVAFPVVFENIIDDMVSVARRLRATDTGVVTVTIENDIIDTLREMIEALKRARQENAKKPPPPGSGGGGGGNQNQPLIQLIQELKMIRSMQLRVNSRTETYGREYAGEQAPAPQAAQTPEEKAKAEMLQKELKNLADRQEKIYEVTNNLYREKNK
jgi:hypothetical protein